MRLLTLASTLLINGLLVLVSAESIELRADNIKSEISKGTWFIEHFSPFCIHCQHFAPTWKKLTEDLKHLEDSSDVHFGAIDCTVQGDLCAEHGIIGLPTIQLWQDGTNAGKYSGPNTYEELSVYMLNKVKAQGPSSSLEAPEDSLETYDDVTEGLPAEKAKAVLPNPDGVSVELDGEKMRKISSGKESWFVKFYAPWCPHCRSLEPTWIEMASQLQGQINVGEVNCDSAASLCREYGIEGFPTLKMFGHKEPIQYSSDRSLVSLVKFANEHSGPIVKEINSIELEQYLAVKDVSFVYLYSNEKTNIPELIENVASEFPTVSFYSTGDKEVLKKYGLSFTDLPAALILKDKNYRLYPSHDFKNSKMNRDKLMSWIEINQYPLVTKLKPKNYQILQGQLPIVLNIVNLKDTVSQSKFHNFAKTWNTSVKSKEDKTIIFGEMNRAMWKDYVLERFNIQNEETSKIIIYDTISYKYYTKDINEQDLSIDKPEELYLALKNIDRLKGKTALALYERVGVSLNHKIQWITKHWFISFIGFSVFGSILYRYLTFHGPKRHGGNSVLPTFRPVNDYSHKD